MRHFRKPGGTKSASLSFEPKREPRVTVGVFFALVLFIFVATPLGMPAQNYPALQAQKLTDFHQIHSRFTNGTVRVMVTLASPTTPSAADFQSPARRASLRSQLRQTQQAVLDTLPAGQLNVRFRFDNIAGFSAEVTTNGLQALQAHPGVLTIEPVMELEPHLAQGIPLIHGMTYRAIYNGSGLAIAICDTGIDYTHARLGGGGFPNSKVIGGYDFGDSDADPLPNTQAHGTCCAGIAAGDLGTVGDYIGGVAYNAKLYALKISSGTSGSATTDAMVAAWDWCVTHQNDDPAHPIMVISTSFGGGQYFSSCDSDTPSMTMAANNAVAAGITVLASSGNDGYCSSMGWPACISSVISVGAVYDAAFGNYLPCVSSGSCAPKISTTGCTTGWYVNDSTAADKVTAYANVASFLTLFAPGNDCYTLDISGISGYSSGDYYANFGGTSAACPYAAGAVACLQSAAKALTGSYLTPADVKNRLLTYGDNVTDTKVAITKPRVNLERAIQSLGTNPITVLNFVSATLIGGNGNQTVDPNECLQLAVAVRNDGNTTATNVTATLSTSTPGLAVMQTSSGYPAIAAGATATNVTTFRLSTTPAFTCGTPASLTLTLNHPGGTNTNTFNLTSSGTSYTVTPSTGASIVAGTTDIGNHGDDLTTTISLPFSYALYGQSYNNATVSGNGNVQFNNNNTAFANVCLPASGFTNTIFAFWDDLRTDGTVGTAQGIYTSTSGNAPNRIFNIEWRASYYAANGKGNPVNFEVRLYEGLSRFDIIYGALNGTGTSATAGVQKDTGTNFTSFSCNAGALSNGLQLTFQSPCPDGGGACVTTLADFAASPIQGTAPLTVKFTNLSSGATNYAWTFGDGHTSASQNPANTYSNAGSYTVSLTAIGAGGTNVLTRTNYIVATNAPPPPAIAAFTANPTNGLAPLTVTFTNLSLNATEFAWDFGDGNTSTNANPINIYTNAGSFTVSLAAIGAGGTNSLTLTNYIVVTNYPPPLAGFTADPTNGLAPLTVTFTNLSLNATEFAWDFGDGNTSTNTNPINTYPNAGSVTVSLTAIGAGGTNTLTITNYIVVTNYPPPLADFSADTTNGIAPLTVTFTNLSLNATEFAWDFGDGNTSTSTNPINTYSNAGGFTVSLTAIGVGGTNTLTITNYIVVTNYPPPLADFSADTTNGIAPLTVTFTNLSLNATEFAWDFGDGNTSINTNPLNTYSNAGSFTVSLTAIGAGGTNTLTITNYIVVTNYPPPMAAFTTDTTNGLAPLAVTFTNLSANATEFAWDFGDGNTSTNINPINIFSNAGNFTVSLTAIGAGGTNTLAITNYIVVTNHPPPMAAFNADTTNGLAPLTVTFTNLSLNATDFAWNFGDGHTSTNVNPINMYSNAGSFTVSLTAIGAGETNTLTITNYIVVTNFPPPVVDFTADLTNGLAPLTVTLTNLSLNATEFAWDFGDGNTSTNVNPINMYSNAGSFTVSLTAIGAGGTNTLTFTNYIIVTNYPPPLADFTANPTNGLAPLTVTFTNLSLNATEFAWDFGDGNASTKANPINIYSNAGSFTVTLTAIGAGGTNTLALINYIVVTNFPPPLADFGADTTNGLAPLTVTFTHLSFNATEFAWDFGDGNTSTNINPINIFSNAGNFTVSLTAVGAGGTNTLTRMNYILVLSPAQLLVSPLNLDFGNVLTGRLAHASFVVSNAGGVALSVTATVALAPFSLLDATSNTVANLAFDLPTLGATNLVVRFAPDAVGTFSNAVVFVSNGGDTTNAIAGTGVGAPTILWPAVDGVDFIFTFDTAAGLIYEVQFKDSLDDPVWQTLQTVPGDGLQRTITNSIATPAQRFYRLRVE